MPCYFVNFVDRYLETCFGVCNLISNVKQSKMKTDKPRKEFHFYIIYERIRKFLKNKDLFTGSLSGMILGLEFNISKFLKPTSKFGALVAILLFGFYKSSAYMSQQSFIVESNKNNSKIVFLKTHKTGSSTIQNIFYRYSLGTVGNDLNNHRLWTTMIIYELNQHLNDP